MEFVDYAKGTLRKLSREIEEFNRRLELLKQFRHLEAEEALAMERDNILYRILAEVGCRDDALEVAYKMFADALEIDTETGIWYFVDEKTGDDGTQDLVAAIKERLPDYLKDKRN